MNVLQISSSGAKLCDEHGDSAGIALAFSLGQHLTLEFDLRGAEADDGVLVPLDRAVLDDCVGFYFALSNVWDAASAPLFLRTSGITVETRNGKTILSVELPDTGATSLISALAGKASAAFTCEIGGLDGNALAVFVWQFQVTVCNRIYLGGDLPESISGDPAYLTAAEVRALIRGGHYLSSASIEFTDGTAPTADVRLAPSGGLSASANGLSVNLNASIFGGTASFSGDHAALQEKQDRSQIEMIASPINGRLDFTPVGGKIYVITGELQALDFVDFDLFSPEEWITYFTFASDAPATVSLVLFGDDLPEMIGDFTFEAGKSYVISCRYGMLVRGERTTVGV